LAATWLVACKSDPVSDPIFIDENSAQRYPGETYEEAESRYRSRLTAVNLSAYLNLHSVKSLAVAVAEMDYASVPVWTDLATLQTAFARGRDERFLFAADRGDFPRRSTWLFPDNGCYARADLLARNLRSWGYPETRKLFVFGTLSVQTDYTTSGTVHWWYHVAPIAAAEDEVYVLDPAVDASSPLTVAAWLATMTSDSSELVLAVCAGRAYGPYSRCQTPQDLGLTRATEEQTAFLDDEWQRLIDLGRDPEAELGDSPPWAE